jgi:zinc resistance-associated protein
LNAKGFFQEIKGMWKKALVGTAALMIAGLMIVYAQQRPEPGGSAEDKGAVTDTGIAALLVGLKPNAEDMAAFSDARMAALHAGLKLNVDQEKIWPAFEQALRDLAKMRTDRFAATRDQRSFSNPVQQLQRQADALIVHGSALKRLADALAPLYQSFDDGQKRRFTKLARFMRPHSLRFGMAWSETDGHGGMRANNFNNRPNNFGGVENMRD